ncbi:Spermidine/putrescine-binding periplasmic protein [subsurface metagenome]
MRKTALVFLLVLVVALPSAAIAKEKNELVICGWGGVGEKMQRKAFYDPFEKETGIRVIAVAPPSSAKIKAMVESGNVEWDLVLGADPLFQPCVKNNLLAKIDYKYFDKKTLDELFPEAKQEYGVGYFYFSTAMVYSTQAYSKDNHPRTWAEFWDVKRFPGLRTLLSPGLVGSAWEYALLADGVPIDKLYDNPDLDRAFKKFTEIKPYVVKWWKQGTTPGQLLIDKEVVLGDAYNGRIQRLKDQGAPVDIEWNQGALWLEYLFIPKGAPHFDNACKFLAFASRPKGQAVHAKLLAYGPVNRAAFDLLSTEEARKLPSYPENKNKQFMMNGKWYRNNAEKVIELWNIWILKK